MLFRSLSFGPALPLGFSSDDEYLDLELTALRAPADVVACLDYARELADFEAVTA